MSEQDQIKKLSEMIGNCILVGDSNEQIAEMALTMALHWNQDTKEAAPEMHRALSEMLDNVKLTELESEYINNLLTKTRGEK